jgi:hypothetical protein
MIIAEIYSDNILIQRLNDINDIRQGIGAYNK